MTAEQPTTSGSFVFSHEVVCGHCGRLVGSYVTSSRHANVLVPMGVRCHHCGGPPVDSGEVVRYLVSEPVYWPPSTRGRPSNATRAKRAAERLAALFEEQAVA